MADFMATDNTAFSTDTNGSIRARNTNSTANTNTVENAKQAVVNSENPQDTIQAHPLYSAAAYNAVANHPLTQNVKDTVANGPVAETAKEQAVKTQNEFSNLAAARTTPSEPAATGQPLTHYHSFFSSLLSWENPRASAIAYVSIVTLIFGARYLNLLRYAFKLTWMILGITVAAEIVGKLAFRQGLTSQIRPRKYYVMPRGTIDSMIGDVHELINFFVIESQRIVFAENVFASTAVLVMAFLSYYLIKIVPFWGLTLIGTSVAFIVPLVYISNQELIDHHVRKASTVVNQQTEQIKQVASHHAAVAAETTKQMASDYTAKAQEMVGAKTGRASSPTATTKPIKTEYTDSSFNASRSAAAPKFEPAVPAYDSAAFPAAAPKFEPAVPAYDSAAFPAAPKSDFTTTIPSVGSTASTLRDEKEPLIIS